MSPSSPDVYEVQCLRCGLYSISGTLSAMLRGKIPTNDFTPDRIANFSSYIRENQGQLFSEQDYEFILKIRTPSVTEKAAKLLRYIANKHPYAGEVFVLPLEEAADHLAAIEACEDDQFENDAGMLRECGEVLSLIAVSWSRNAGELLFLLHKHLGIANRFLVPDGSSLTITSAGWNYLESLQVPFSDNPQVFVAMWFNPSTDDVWKEAIRSAIYDAGYHPVRIDAVEHTNKIDDEILAQIRSSKFMVADFTGQRGGVYFEAGFALGLGKRVIWCVEKEEIKNVHFDNRQYNFLRWTRTELQIFRRALANRIEALFGRGPLAPRVSSR